MSKSSESPYTPVWKGPIEGYVVNYINRQFWKVEATQERADLVQEAYLIFDRCAKRYPDMDTPQHFMALFKSAWHRHFIDLANADTATRSNLVPIVARQDADGEEMRLQEPMGEADNEGILGSMLRSAPAEVLLVLKLFLSAPQELVELALDSWNPDGVRGNHGSKRINKLLGFPPSYDSVGAVREYFAVH